MGLNDPKKPAEMGFVGSNGFKSQESKDKPSVCHQTGAMKINPAYSFLKMHSFTRLYVNVLINILAIKLTR